MRQKASTEIDRLLAFLDACDPYVTTELEENCEDEAAQCEDEAAQCEDEARKAITSRAWAVWILPRPRAMGGWGPPRHRAGRRRVRHWRPGRTGRTGSVPRLAKRGDASDAQHG